MTNISKYNAIFMSGLSVIQRLQENVAAVENGYVC